MVDSYSRKKVEMSTSVDKMYTCVHRKNIKLSEDTYDELLRLKVVLRARSFEEVIRMLTNSSEIDPTRVAEKKIEELENELGELVPHAYGAISQALVLCRLALHLDKARCDALQLELLSVLREIKR